MLKAKAICFFIISTWDYPGAIFESPHHRLWATTSRQVVSHCFLFFLCVISRHHFGRAIFTHIHRLWGVPRFCCFIMRIDIFCFILIDLAHLYCPIGSSLEGLGYKSPWAESVTRLYRFSMMHLYRNKWMVLISAEWVKGKEMAAWWTYSFFKVSDIHVLDQSTSWMVE